MKKTDIIHLLSRQRHYQHYLEICTIITGNYYHEIDRTRFLTCRRLMYYCHDDFNDGLPIDYRQQDFDISPALDQLRSSHQYFDISLVDSHHTYDCSLRDLVEAHALLADGGALVVHDCLPPSVEAASPTWIPGPWCGVSYKAFLDFVVRRDDIDYYTIDADYGCGVIVKNASLSARVARLSLRVRRGLSRDLREKVVRGWLEIGGDFARAFDYFNANKASLLQLISIEQFLERVSSENA